MEMNVNGILKKSQLQSGFDEARVVVGAGGYSLLNGKRECLVNGYVPGACLFIYRARISSGRGLTMTGHIPQVMITGHYFIDR